MNRWSDMDYDMHQVPLDLDTADRLLAGTVAPEDAPPGYARVASLLEAASTNPKGGALDREAEVVRLLADMVRSSSHKEAPSPRRPFMPFTLSRPRFAAVFVAAALACTAGLASAGSLPSAAQDIAAAILAKVGVSVPGPNEHSGTHSDLRGGPQNVLADAAARSGIAELATTTELEGVEKGAAISTAASDGKSHAGQKGSAVQGSAQTGTANVPTPNGGGTGTADTASGGKSSHGTSTASTASGGHSRAGSGNASGGQETADTASGGRSSAGTANGNGGNSAP